MLTCSVVTQSTLIASLCACQSANYQHRHTLQLSTAVTVVLYTFLDVHYAIMQLTALG